MTRITGHRGARDLWPENSLTGFRAAMQLPLDQIELDVHLTAASELVVIHDARLDRTSDGRGPVRLMTAEARRATRLSGLDEPPPLLAEVLALLAGRPDLMLHVELKVDDRELPYGGLEAAVIAEVERLELSARTVLTSFDHGVLRTCRSLAPHIARLVSAGPEQVAAAGGIAAFLAGAIELVDLIALRQDVMDSEWEAIIALVPRERLCVWTVNDAAEMARWIDRGIGHLTTDRPDLALAARDGSQADAPSA